MKTQTSIDILISIMKSVILALIVAVALIVPARAMSCRTEPERCEAGTCCVSFGPFGKCRPLLKEGEQCELNQLKSKLNDHMFLMKCPCADGLECEEDDSGSLLQGKCVAKK